ncbi:hypothetical protein [Amycolatopsis sp. NPDC059657]|uniref:hypothetical protein n=1 Tax=Amycolatopsis sp. NPDC059657 TaxID=3346899 RepID=UPI00366B653D
MNSQRERSGKAWVEFDQRARGSGRNLAGLGRELVPDDLLDVICKASDRDGHVREKAVLRMAAAGRAELLPALVLRAADWVPQVRVAAMRALVESLRADLEAAVPALLPVAVAIGERQHGRWLLGNLEDFLRAGSPELIRACLRIPDAKARQAVSAIVSDRRTVEDLVDTALTDRDTLIRVQCAKDAVRRSPEVASILLRRGVSGVRVVALFALREHTDLLEAALDDRSGHVRSVAQYLLTRAGGDPAARYRALVAAGDPPSVGALGGLADVGTPEDASLVLPWLAHPLPRGRAEVVRALRRFRAVSVPTLVPLLTDSPVVSRQVVAALTDHAALVDEDHLWTLVDSDVAPFVRIGALRLLRERGSWEQAITDLRLAITRDDELARIARESLAHGYGQRLTYLQPRPAQRARLDALLERADPDLAGYLRPWLKDS